MENKVTFVLSDEEKTQVMDAVGVLTAVLEPKLTNLSADDKKELPKMGDKTVSFVEKSLEYAEQYPDYIPAFINVAEAKVDLQSVRALRQLFLPLERITNEIDSTITLAGSEAFSSSLSIYKVLKNAAVMGQAGASEATADLSSRFPGKKRTSTETAE